MDHLHSEIPVLDLDDFTLGDRKKRSQFVKRLGEAYNKIGFVTIKNHGLSDDICRNLYNVVQKFFNQPDETIEKYEIEGLYGQRGYTGKGKEHAKGRVTGDLKEFFHIGQEIDSDDDLASEYPLNVWPKELPDFKTHTLEVYRTLEHAGKMILRAIALYLELDEYYFDKK